VHRRRDFVDLVGCQSGMEWQREYLLADARGNRAVGRIERGQCLLFRDRHRVVNQGFDAARGKMRLQLAPCLVPDDEPFRALFTQVATMPEAYRVVTKPLEATPTHVSMAAN